MPTHLERQIADAEISVDFEDAREEALIRIAVLGKDARDFLESPVGQFVIGAARQDQMEVEEQLTKVSPLSIFGRRKIARLQQKHAAVTMAIGWLTEAVRLGADAERELEKPVE